MKRILAALVLALASQYGFAEAKYGMAGCGLGAVWFGDQNQIFAATTNSSSYNQGFAMSSGTSNCVENPHQAAIQTQQKFFADNLKVLSKEMAQGDGQYVRALASTMGCTDDMQATFGSEMQKSYSQIFSAPGAGAMLTRIRGVIQENKQLSAACTDAVI